MYLIGNSLGANIVANYLGEEGSECFIKAAVCVQPPMKMWETAVNIERRLFGFYNWALGKNYKNKMLKWGPSISEAYKVTHGIDIHDILRKSRHMIDIDTHMTSKVFGYGDIKTYHD